MNKTPKRRYNQRRPRARPNATARRGPDFASGILDEPSIVLGGGSRHVDPKIGLSLYGPYTLPGQAKPALSTIIVGLVGPASMVADADAWLKACQGIITNDGSQPHLYPHFPGINSEHPFQCELAIGEPWRATIREEHVDEAISAADLHERIKRVVMLYVSSLETLAGRDPLPNVVLFCIPQVVIDRCVPKVSGSRGGAASNLRSRPRSAWLPSHRQQLLLFPSDGSEETSEVEGIGYENLRRGLKAEAMRFGIPSQLVLPRSLSLIEIERRPGERNVQDPATRAWNLITALYHKAGSPPWRLDEVDPGVCFVGIAFYKELSSRKSSMRTSMAQAFTATGDGYVLRGDSFEWDDSESVSSPHLDRASALSLMQSVLDVYKRQNRGSLPNRVVVHKSSRYTEPELSGLREACKFIPEKDFVAFGHRRIQFFRAGSYPPLRGTYIKLEDRDLVLYTSGYSPYLGTYPGARAPQPLEVVEHHGDSGWDRVLREILALTKMNWNTADFFCSEPITIAFARRVGQVLAELPPDREFRPEYRYYM